MFAGARATPSPRIATWTIARAVRDALAQNGFQVRKATGLPPKRVEGTIEIRTGPIEVDDTLLTREKRLDPAP